MLRVFECKAGEELECLTSVNTEVIDELGWDITPEQSLVLSKEVCDRCFSNLGLHSLNLMV